MEKITSAVLPAPVATKWPWLPQRVHFAWAVMMLALCFGLLSVAAVREMATECRNEPIKLLKLEDGVSWLLAEEQLRKCQLVLGDHRIPMPSRTVPVAPR